MQPAISMVSVPTAVGRYAVLAASTIPFRPSRGSTTNLTRGGGDAKFACTPTPVSKIGCLAHAPLPPSPF